jgi:hypothetical protein
MIFWVVDFGISGPDPNPQTPLNQNPIQIRFKNTIRPGKSSRYLQIYINIAVTKEPPRQGYSCYPSREPPRQGYSCYLRASSSMI